MGEKSGKRRNQQMKTASANFKLKRPAEKKRELEAQREALNEQRNFSMQLLHCVLTFL